MTEFDTLRCRYDVQQDLLDEDVVKATVKALQANGLAKLGYTYVNLDDGCVPCRKAALTHASSHPVW